VSEPKTVLITGATRGIGFSLSRNFLRDGWNVLACGRDNARLLAIPDAPTKQFLPLVFDMRDDDAMKTAVEKSYAHFPEIDLIINNAGIHFKGTLETTPDEFRSLLEVNVEAIHSILRIVVPRMVERKSGTIVNISSVAGIHGYAGVGAYGASKFALRGLSQSLVNELSPHGIKVSCLCPSWVDTDMAKHSPVAPEHLISSRDIYEAIKFILALGPNATVPELVLRCCSDLD